MHVLQTKFVSLESLFFEILHWEESGWNLNLLSTMFYLQQDKLKTPFIKISSAVAICGFCLGRRPSVAARCGWDHNPIFLMSKSSRRSARWHGGCVLFFFWSAYFSDFTRTVQKVNIFNNCWVRLVVAKSERTERKEGMEASERKDWCECDERAKMWLGGVCERVNESLLTFPSLTYTQPRTDGPLVYLYLKDYIFPS